MGNIDSTLQTSAHAGTTQSSGNSGGPPPSNTAQSPGGGGADLFSLSSLLSTLNEDLERLQELEESWFNLLDDEWVVTRHLGRLESSQTRWASDDELLAKLKRRKEKGRDIENALALLCEQYLHLNQTQIKWLTKEIASICAHSTSSFDTLLSLRKKQLENSHLALLRSHMRLGVIRRCWDKRAEEELKTRRGEFVLNLFNNCDSEEAGVLKVLLARLAELPNLHLSLSEEVANFLELQAAAKEAMPSSSDVEDKSKGKEKAETSSSSSATSSTSQDKPATQTSPVKKSLPSLQEQEEHKRSRRLSVKEEKEEEKQFRKSLLYMLTNHVWNRAKQAISRAATSYQQPEEEASQAMPSSKDKDKDDTKSSSKGDLPYLPSLTLLTALQKDLIRQVVCCKDNQDPAFRMFLLYVRLTLELAIEFQDAVFATNLFLTRNSPGKSMDAYLLRSIDASPLNQLLRYLLLAVSLFCSPTLSPPSTVTQASSATAPYVWRYFDFRDELSENMLPLLVEFMKRLDSFNIKSTAITAEEMDYLDTERVVSSSCYGNAMAPAMEVESPHKYYPDADEEKVITIPGATHLCVTFDPRCSTKDNGDWLQLYRGPFQTEPILTKFCGPSTNWPKVPIIVPGDTVVFHFHSNSFQTYWGYRCIVTPLVLGQCRSWLYELERTVAHLTANTLGCMLIGPRVTSLEKRYEPLLQSPLFSGGWEEEQMFEEDSPSSKKPQDRMEAEEEEEEEEGEEQAEEGERRKSRSRAASNNRRKGRKRKKADEAAEFLEDFIKDENSVGAKMFLTLTRKHLPMSPTDMMGGSHVALATRYYIATNVKHLGLAAAALNSETRTEEQTSQLVEICREAQKVRRWIVQTSQHRLLQEEERLEEERELARQRGETLPDKEKERQPEFADPNAKYFELSNQVIENMKLLLRLKSCTSTPGLSSSTSLGHGGACGEEEEFLTTEEKFISSMSSALSPTMSRRLNKKKDKQQRNFVSLRQSQESQEDKSSLQLWKSLFETWQALQSHHRHHHQQGRGFLTNSKGRRQRRQNLFATLPVHIFSFIQNEGESGSTSTLIELLNRRLTRARGRIAALNALYELLTSLKLTSVQHDMLKVVGPALVTMRHYLKDVLACGPAFEKKLEVSFVHLYSYLAKLLVNESLDPTTRALSLQAWCLSFMPKDHPFLMHVQIFDTLRKLTFQGLHASSSSSQQYLTESEKEEVLNKGKQHSATNAEEKSCDKKLDQRFKHLASLTYRLLVIVCVGQNKGSREANNNGANNKEQTTMITDAKTKEEEEKVTDKLDTFQQHVLDIIFSDITGSIAKLGQKRKNFVSQTVIRGGEQDDETEFENGGGEVSSQIATNHDHKIDDYHQEERFCYSMLMLLGVISIREGEGEVSTVLALVSSSSSSASSSSASPSSSPMLSSRAAALAVPSSASSTLSPKINLRRSASALSTSSSGVMTSPKVLKVFLQLLRLGTPRIQRLVLRLLRHVLPKIDPALFITNAELRQELRLYKDWDELFCCSRKDLLHAVGTTPEENGSMMELEQGTKTDEDDLTPEMAFIHCFFDVIGRALEIQIHTDRAASSSSSSSSSPSSSSSMFSGLLAMNIETEEEGTANISLIQNPLSPSKTLSPSLQNYRDGQVKFNEISEMVMLFRHLLNTTTSSSYIPQWTTLLQQAMLQAIQKIPSMVDPATQTIRSSFYNDLLKSNSNNNHKILWRAFAALSIIGGHTDRMRVGARVATKTEGAQQETGTVTFYDRDSAEARVIFDSNIGQIIKVSSEMLRPIPEIAANTERFPITADVIPSVILFAVEPLQTKSRRSDLLSSSAGTGGNKNSTNNSRLSKIAKAQVKPKLKPKAKKDKSSSSQVKKEPWSCPACTFINIPAAQNCEICNTANPAMGPVKSAFLKKQESDSSIENSASDSHEEFIDVDNIVFEEDETLSDDEEEVDAGHCAADLLFHQLRSRVLKYLCTALADKNGSSTSELYAQKLFPTLLKMAISPTQLDEFHSLENMEKIEDRLWELLYGIRDQFYPTQHLKEEAGRKDETIDKGDEKTLKKFVFKDEIYAVRDRWNRTSRLKYSPLNLLQFHLPTAMDRGTARNIAFSLRNPRLMMGQCPDPQSIGLAKANYSIPNTVPAFYFEVKILGEKRNSGASSSEGHKYPRVAIGLYRDGMPLFGSPGNNSYCFQADEGATYHNSDLPVDPAYGPRCGVGDVIGCGWSHRLGILFVTKNGQTLGPAFDNVNGRFSPALWIATDRCRVVVNFGQERFYYNYMEILPENYVEQLVENAEQTSSLTPVEIKRRTDAEMLQSMTPMFPLELCVIALEKSNDDMQVAANWLFENGFRELERMEAESLERSRQEDAERQEQWLQQLLVQNGGENSDDIPPEILSAIAASSSASSSSSSATSSTTATAAMEEEPPQEQEAEDEDEFTNFEREEEDELFQTSSESQEGGRYLDDEIGADAPVQIARTQRQGRELETVTIKEITPGMLLCVSPSAAVNSQTPSWHPSMDMFAGRTGVVTAVNPDLLMVELRFFDADTCSKRSFWFSFQVLEKPRDMWQDPCVELCTAAPIKIKNALVEVETALAILKVRRAMLSLIAEWPTFPIAIDSQESMKSVMDLLKLASAEFLYSGAESSGRAQQGSPLLDTFRAKLAALLKEEPARAIPLQIDYQQYSKRGRLRSSLNNRTQQKNQDTQSSSDDMEEASFSSSPSLVQTLTKECIIHFIQAVEVPPPVLVEESEHPYRPNVDVRSKFHIPGASSLMIRFDSRCSINHSEMMTSVSFYRDELHQDLIQRFQGRGSNFRPLVIHSDRFWYRFTSGPGTTYWGVRFSIIPLVFRLNDREALDGLNFELGYWLLELLMSDAKESIIRNEYIIDLCEALMWYVRYAKRASKMRGIQLLIRVIQEIPQAPLAVQKKALVPLNKLMTIRNKINRIYELEKQSNNQLYSSYFQSLVELVCVTRLAVSSVNLNLRRKVEEEGAIQSKGPSPSETSTKNKDKEKEKDKEKDGKYSFTEFISELSKMSTSPTSPISVLRRSSSATPTSSSSSSDESGPQISIMDLNNVKLQILSASYVAIGEEGSTHNNNNKNNRRRAGSRRRSSSSASASSKQEPSSPFSKDITGELQQYVNECGGNCLYLSSVGATSNYPFFNANGDDGAKELRVKYIIFDSASGVLVDEGSESARDGEPMFITSGGTWFDHVVSVADAAHSLVTKRIFSHALLLQAYRLEKLHESFYPLARNVTLNDAEDGVIVADPGPFGNAFSVCMWVYLREGHTGSRRVIFWKGDSSSSASSSSSPPAFSQTFITPSLSMNDGDSRLIFTVSTDHHNNESCTTKKELTLNSWTHVACCCDGNNLRVYINGSLDNEHVLSDHQVVRVNSFPICLGRVPLSTAGIEPIKGALMDCRMYLRTLSDNEVKHIVKTSKPKNQRNIQSPLHSPPPSLPTVCRDKLPHILYQRSTQWTLAMDQQLVELVLSCGKEGGGGSSSSSSKNKSKKHKLQEDVDPFHMPLDEIEPSSTLLARHHLLRHLPLAELRFRFCLIRLFNTQLADVLPLLDFSQSHVNWSLVRSLCNLKGIIFMQTKLTLWNKILRITTSSPSRPNITVNRARALKALEKKEPDGTRSVFGQIFTQLHFVSPTFLRHSVGQQTWDVTYAGEGGRDAGGLFRDSVSHICSDLMSRNTPLFIPCPNSRGFGDNQDKFIPNPSCTSSLHLSMYQFVGKLMGLALRAKHILNLDLPSIVWKPLVGDELSPEHEEDLEAIDSFCCQVLNKVMNIEKEGVTEETFRDIIPYTFSTTSSDGREIELVEGGKSIPVTWHNRKEWVELVYNYRLHEFSVQVEAIRKGMAAVVPVQLLPLFTWKELEMTVCGSHEIDLSLLKRNTRYKGFTPKDQAIRWMWEMLEGFNHKERELFLRFVWGRSRLPLRSEDFTQQMVIMEFSPPGRGWGEPALSGSAVDGCLPVSHTCFFQLELPRYSSKAIMASKVLYAITECRAIDTDHAAQNVDWDAED